MIVSEVLSYRYELTPVVVFLFREDYPFRNLEKMLNAIRFSFHLHYTSVSYP